MAKDVEKEKERVKMLQLSELNIEKHLKEEYMEMQLEQ